MAQLGLTVVNKVILEFAMDIQYIKQPEGDLAALHIKIYSDTSLKKQYVFCLHSPHSNCTSLCLALPTILGGWQGPGGTLNVRTGTLTVHFGSNEKSGENNTREKAQLL